MRGKIQLSQRSPPAEDAPCSDTHHQGSASMRHEIFITSPTQTSVKSAGRFPGGFRRQRSKHCVTLHLTSFPFVFYGWIPGSAGYLCARGLQQTRAEVQRASRGCEQPLVSLAITFKAWKAFLVVSNFHLWSIFLVSSCSAFIHLQGIALQ